MRWLQRKKGRDSSDSEDDETARVRRRVQLQRTKELRLPLPRPGGAALHAAPARLAPARSAPAPARTAPSRSALAPARSAPVPAATDGLTAALLMALQKASDEVVTFPPAPSQTPPLPAVAPAAPLSSVAAPPPAGPSYHAPPWLWAHQARFAQLRQESATGGGGPATPLLHDIQRQGAIFQLAVALFPGPAQE